VLRELIGKLHDHDVRLVLAEASPLVGSRLIRYRLMDAIGEDAVFKTVRDGVDGYRRTDR
jgi:hypothetical protein